MLCIATHLGARGRFPSDGEFRLSDAEHRGNAFPCGAWERGDRGNAFPCGAWERGVVRKRAYAPTCTDSRTLSSCPAEPSLVFLWVMYLAYSGMNFLPGVRGSKSSGLSRNDSR